VDETHRSRIVNETGTDMIVSEMHASMIAHGARTNMIAYETHTSMFLRVSSTKMIMVKDTRAWLGMKYADMIAYFLNVSSYTLSSHFIS
jgi:predicted DNA binding CopG/RHH family protein